MEKSASPLQSTSERVVAENNGLVHLLVAVELNKPGTVDSRAKEQQVAIKEAYSGGTPVSCQKVVAAMGSTAVRPFLPEIMVCGRNTVRI